MYYHLSRRWLGHEATFSPRIPLRVLPREETRTPRICVSPTVAQAWMALGCRAESYYVYGFDSRELYRPTKREVPDVDITDEYWITEPCRGRIMGTITHWTVPSQWPGKWQAYYVAVRTRRDYRVRVECTISDLRESLSRVARPYVAFSGGKDSLALLLLLRDLHRTDIPVMTQTDDLDWPWKRAYCECVTSSLGFGDVTFAASTVSAKAQLADALRTGEAIRGTLSHVIERYVTERDRDAVILGLRREESRVRRYAVRSTCYRTRSGMTHICPLARWTSEEVVAYIASHDMPLAPVYCGAQRYPHEVRMSWPVPPELARHGDATWLRIEHGDVWRELASDVPELRDVS